MKQKSKDADAVTVALYLGGLPSAALLAKMSLTGERPDAVVTPDSGAETVESMRYLDVLAGWLSRKGFPSLTVVRATGTLENRCQTRKELPDPVSCSYSYRQRPVESHLAERYGTDGFVVLFPTDPGVAYAPRAVASRVGPSRYRFPLEGLSRREYERSVLEAGLPLPPGGGCFFCPLSSPAEVRSLTEQQASRAVALEVVSGQKLGGAWAWSAVINRKIHPADGPRPSPEWCRQGRDR